MDWRDLDPKEEPFSSKPERMDAKLKAALKRIASTAGVVFDYSLKKLGQNGAYMRQFRPSERTAVAKYLLRRFEQDPPDIKTCTLRRPHGD